MPQGFLRIHLQSVVLIDREKMMDIAQPMGRNIYVPSLISYNVRIVSLACIQNKRNKRKRKCVMYDAFPFFIIHYLIFSFFSYVTIKLLFVIFFGYFNISV